MNGVLNLKSQLKFGYFEVSYFVVAEKLIAAKVGLKGLRRVSLIRTRLYHTLNFQPITARII